MALQVSISREDVTTATADVLLLKHARGFHGADEAVALRLVQRGYAERELSPAEGEFRLIESRGAIGAEHVLFLGTPYLGQFRYREIRHFARRAIEVLAAERVSVRTLATTVHGAGYGLDIEEAFRSMILGFQQGLTTHPLSALSRLVFVERSARRFEILRTLLADVELVMPATPHSSAALAQASGAAEPERKKSAFVAMPFTEEFEDVYQFGICAAVHRCGYLCEKVDESVFTGNIVERITEGIKHASFVVADLSLEKPNVYLEVGFAWGLQKPVILVAKEGQRLHFDVSHHKCLFYKNIGKLSEALEKTIRNLCGPATPGATAHA